MASSPQLRNEVASSLASDGWRITQKACALPFPLVDRYEDESASAFIAEKAGQQLVIVAKRVAPTSEYPQIIREIIERHARIPPSVGEIETEIIIDDSQGHYALGHNGWVNGHRVHGNVIHVDIREDKIWIQHDGTEHDVANELIAAGVPKENILLAFQSPEIRKFTEFAVALGESLEFGAILDTMIRLYLCTDGTVR